MKVSLVCRVCGVPFQGRRDALYCSSKCRSASSRAGLGSEYLAAYGRSRRAANRRWVDEYKTSRGCIDCGYNAHPVALDLDHVSGVKRMNVTVMMGYRLERLQEEVAKCEVRCANCHRIRHFGSTPTP